MFERHGLSSLSILILVCCAVVVAIPLYSQTAAADLSNDRPVFKAVARTVVVDVVVTGRNGQPVRGLTREDFQVAEDGHSQNITFFEEHTGAQTVQADLPKLPPNVFTNIPRFASGGAVTVLLLDNLNTELKDQTDLRLRMLEYLKGVQPGGRFAIFALGMQLRYVQGLTDDPATLEAALRDPKRGAVAESSPLLVQDEETEMGLSLLDSRVRLTMQAFEQIAHYLAGVPGRKSVVWFSSSFPLLVQQGDKRDYRDQVKKTEAVLSAAGVALYPIASESLATDSCSDAATQLQQACSALQEEQRRRNANHATSDQIARDTGGDAVYNTNDLNNALARVAKDGSYHYTLAYTPTNSARDGQFRKIEIKLKGAKYKLAYRRGYNAANAQPAQSASTAPPSDPLRDYMNPGMPDSTQMPLAVRVQAEQPQAGAKTPHAGDNVSVQGPLTRYAANFVIAASGLQLNPTSDGGYGGKIEAALVVYGQDGKPLNWLVRQLDLTMDASRYKEVQANGVNFRLEIDVPKNAVVLRSGVYDWNSGQAGTLEVALNKIIGANQQGGYIKE